MLLFGLSVKTPWQLLRGVVQGSGEAPGRFAAGFSPRVETTERGRSRLKTASDVIRPTLPDAIGAYLPGQQASFEIVGVMPPGFSYPVDTYVLGIREPTDVWVPYVFSSEDRVRGNRYGYNLHVIGRLRDGVSIERAQARMSQITAGLAAVTPRWFRDRCSESVCQQPKSPSRKWRGFWSGPLRS